MLGMQYPQHRVFFDRICRKNRHYLSLRVIISQMPHLVSSLAPLQLVSYNFTSTGNSTLILSLILPTDDGALLSKFWRVIYRINSSEISFYFFCWQTFVLALLVM